MKQITLRGIPEEISEAVRKEAERKGVSLNKAFITLLEKRTGTGKRERKEKVVHHDLDHLSGTWTKRDAENFNRDLESLREIDEEVWKRTG